MRQETRVTMQYYHEHNLSQDLMLKLLSERQEEAACSRWQAAYVRLTGVIAWPCPDLSVAPVLESTTSITRTHHFYRTKGHCPSGFHPGMLALALCLLLCPG